MAALLEIDWKTPVKLIDHGGVPEQYHLFDSESSLAIRAAVAARRALLVRGEPGVGKTQLAAAAARVLKRPFVPRVIDSRTESRDLMWEFDAIMRLADAQVAAALQSQNSDFGNTATQKTEYLQKNDIRTHLAVSNYVRPGPLWWAFDWKTASAQADRTNTPHPVCDSAADPLNGCVVLIDEIDKADPDLPNGLLEALGSGQFTPLGRSTPVIVQGEFPLVVITTNQERALPDAFVRRCLVLELELPKDDAKLVEHLVTRAAVHFQKHAEQSRDLFESAAQLLIEDRRAAMERNLTPLPGQAEYLDLLRATFKLASDSGGRPDEILRSVSKYTVRKYGAIDP